LTHIIEDTEMLSPEELLAGFLSTAGKAADAGVRLPESTRAVVSQVVNGSGDVAESTGPMVSEDEACWMTGRGPTGRCRNFRQMNSAKLLDVLYTVRREANDSYALNALIAEATSRGLTF